MAVAALVDNFVPEALGVGTYDGMRGMAVVAGGQGFVRVGYFG